MSRVRYLAPSVEIVLFRCIFNVVGLVGWDDTLPLYCNLLPPAVTRNW